MAEIEDERLWTKDFTVALSISVFIGFVFYLLMTSMAGYAVTRFSASDSTAGLASSAFVVGALATRIIAGKLLDIIGRNRMIRIFLLVAFGISMLYFIADDLWMLIGVRFLHGAAFGFCHTALIAGVQGIIPNSRRAEGTGWFASSTTLASAFGPLIAVSAISSYGYDAVFAASAVFGLIGILGLPFLRLPEHPLSAVERRAALSFHPSTIVDPIGLRIGGVVMLCAVAYSGVLAFLAQHAERADLGEQVFLFFMAFAAASLLARITLGRVQDVYGDNIVVLPLYATYVVGLVLLALGPVLWSLIAAGALCGIGFGTLMTSLQAAAVRVAGVTRVGLVSSTYFLLMDVGMGFGPVVLGGLVSAGDFSLVYWACAALIVVSAAAYILVHGRTPAGGRPSL